MSVYEPDKIKSFRALGDQIIVTDMQFSERLSRGGLILPTDDSKIQGVRPRWGKVFAIGPNQHDVTVGQWLLIAHGRWTRGITIEDPNGKHTIRRIDPNDILLVSDEEPVDETMGDPL